MEKVFQKEIRFDKIGTFLLIVIICIMSLFGSSVYAFNYSDITIEKDGNVLHCPDFSIPEEGYDNVVVCYYGDNFRVFCFKTEDLNKILYLPSSQLFTLKDSATLTFYEARATTYFYQPFKKDTGRFQMYPQILYSSFDLKNTVGDITYPAYSESQRGTGGNGSSTGGDIGDGNGDNDSDSEDDINSGDSDIGIIDSIKNIAKNIIEIPIKIAETIADIFIPDTEKIKGYFEEVKQAYISKFSLSLDLSSMFSNGEQSSDFYITYKNRQYKILDINIFYTYYNNFRPFVRAFFAVLVFIYNYKKYQEFVGGGAE